MNPAEYEALYRLEEGLWWFVGMRGIVDALLGERIRPGLRCLEAGCGTGYNTLDFHRRYGWEVYPLDYSWEALAWSAQRRASRLLRGDVAALPYADASFDCVTSLDVLVMLEPERGRLALAEFHRILRPGGFLLVRTAALELLRGHHSHVQHEVHRYTLGELEDALRDEGFIVERATYALCLLLPLVFIKRRVLEPLRLVRLKSDVSPTAPWLDWLLRQTLLLEARLMRLGGRLPAGVSVLAVARRSP
jgi:SAM-dependent methyltransferase